MIVTFIHTNYDTMSDDVSNIVDYWPSKNFFEKSHAYGTQKEIFNLHFTLLEVLDSALFTGNVGKLVSQIATKI